MYSLLKEWLIVTSIIRDNSRLRFFDLRTLKSDLYVPQLNFSVLSWSVTTRLDPILFIPRIVTFLLPDDFSAPCSVCTTFSYSVRQSRWLFSSVTLRSLMLAFFLHLTKNQHLHYLSFRSWGPILPPLVATYWHCRDFCWKQRYLVYILKR